MNIKRDLKHLYQRHTRGWSDDECWDMKYYLLKWIKEHFKVYLEQAPQAVDLTYWKFEHKGVEMTQEQLMKRVVDLCEILLYEDGYLHSLDVAESIEVEVQAKNELYDILKLIHFQLWW